MFYAEYGDLVKQRPFDAPIGCPCTAEQLCNAPDLADYFDDDCSIPRHGVRTYSIHGGAGKRHGKVAPKLAGLHWRAMACWCDKFLRSNAFVDSSLHVLMLH